MFVRGDLLPTPLPGLADEPVGVDLVFDDATAKAHGVSPRTGSGRPTTALIHRGVRAEDLLDLVQPDLEPGGVDRNP